MSLRSLQPSSKSHRARITLVSVYLPTEVGIGVVYHLGDLMTVWNGPKKGLTMVVPCDGIVKGGGWGERRLGGLG